LSSPRLSAFLPLICDSGDGECRVPHTDARPFPALTEANICLQCASPYNTQCGFSNCALTKTAGADWHLQLFNCACAVCARSTTQRESLVERHRFRRLDAALGVDESAEHILQQGAHAVPVLCIRQTPLATPATSALWRFLRSPAWPTPEQIDGVFGSFDRTVVFVGGTEAGRRLFERRVAARTLELSERFQLCVPPAVLSPSGAESVLYARALFLRLALAYDVLRALQVDTSLSTCGDARQLELALQLFIDTHLDLHIFCDLAQNWSDAYLDKPTLEAMVRTELGHALHENNCTQARRHLEDAGLAECVLLAPIERYYPHPLRAAYAGELLEMGATLVHANIWMQVDDERSTRATAFAHVFLRKSLDHKCMIRNFHGMLCSEIGAQPALVPFVINLIETTLLGVYEHSTYRPLWKARLSLRRSFHWDRVALKTWCAACHPKSRTPCPHCESAESGRASKRDHESHFCDFCAYIHRNKRLVFFAIKEFYIYNVRMNGLLDSMLENEPTWITHYSLVANALDDARRTFSAAFDCVHELSARSLEQTEAKIDRQLVLHHDCSKPTMRRLRKWPNFYAQLLSVCTTIHDKRFASKQWTGLQQAQDFLRASSGDAAELPPRDKWPEFYACDAPLAHLGGRRWCDVYSIEHVATVARYCERVHGELMPSLLRVVGLSKHADDTISDLFFQLEVRDMPDGRLISAIEAMAGSHPVDFHLMHLFVRQMHQSAAIKLLPLDAEQGRAQETAIRLRMRLEPWEPIPPDADCIFVCRTHAHVFSDVSPHVDMAAEAALAVQRDGSLLDLESTSSIHGVCGTLYDGNSERLVCSRSLHSTTNQQWEKLGLLCATWIDGNEKRVRSIIETRHNNRACQLAPVEKIRLLGHACIVGQVKYTFCVKCGVVCQWRDSSMSVHGMTCGREHRLVERGRYLNVTQVSTGGAATGELTELDETLIMPLRGQNSRGDLFERVSTPLFNTESDAQLIRAANLSEMHGYRKVVPNSTDVLEATVLRDASKQPPPLLRKQAGTRKLHANVERVPYHRLHLQMPPDLELSAQDWEALSDEYRLYAWMPAGRIFWKNYAKLRKATNVPPALMTMLQKNELQRVANLRADGVYEKSMRHATQAEAFAAEQAKMAQRVHVDELSNEDVIAFRNLLLDSGLLERKTELVCAFCRALCERLTNFCRITVNNVDNTLIDSQTGEPLNQPGLVNVYFCAKCYKSCRPLFDHKPVPLVSDIYLYCVARRQKVLDQAIKFLQRGR
jgi:hypothetical protein